MHHNSDMNSPAKLAALLFPFALASNASAQVVVDNINIINSFGGQVLSMGGVIPSGQGMFSFLFTSSDLLQTTISYYSIAEHCALFVVPSGVVFDSDYVAGHAPLVRNNNNPGRVQLSFSTETLMLGLWDDRSIWVAGVQGQPDPGDYYGWVEISQSPKLDFSGVVWAVNRSATATSKGIITGTSTQIPEPSNYATWCGVVGFIHFALKRRRCGVVG